MSVNLDSGIAVLSGKIEGFWGVDDSMPYPHRDGNGSLGGGRVIRQISRTDSVAVAHGFAALSSFGRRDQYPVFTIRRKHPVVPGKVATRFGN